MEVRERRRKSQEGVKKKPKKVAWYLCPPIDNGRYPKLKKEERSDKSEGRRIKEIRGQHFSSAWVLGVKLIASRASSDRDQNVAISGSDGNG